MYVCMSACMCTCMTMYISICMNVCMYIYWFRHPSNMVIILPNIICTLLQPNILYLGMGGGGVANIVCGTWHLYCYLFCDIVCLVHYDMT